MAGKSAAAGRRTLRWADEDREGRSLGTFLRLTRERATDWAWTGASHLLGLMLFALGLALALALLTWSPYDPSWNTATAVAPANWLGLTGAIFADAALQLVGLGAYLFALPPIAWGLRLLALAGEPRWTTRFIAWPVAILSAASFAGQFGGPDAWPLAAGLGGVFGDTFAAGLAKLVAGPWAAAFGALGFILLAALAVVSAAIACGLNFAQIERAAGYTAGAGRFVRDNLNISWPRWGRAAADDDEDEDGEAEDDAEDNEDEAPPAPRRARDATPPGGAVPERLVPANDSRPRIEPRVMRAKPQRTGKRAEAAAQPQLKLVDDGDFEFPPLDLLAKPKHTGEMLRESDEALEQNARLLETVLADFGVRGAITHVRPGPVVTMYELEPAAGIKASRVISLSDDIARSMSAVSARVAVVPGRNVIGIELPNRRRETVYLRELLAAPEYESDTAGLTLALGRDISGASVLADLARMPHLLIAGTTGSGKSVAINTMILSLLYRLSPDRCRLILIDPKMLELSVYDGIPHLLAPVVTEPKKAIAALKWTVREMEDRYRKMSKLGVRNIAGYNERVSRALAKGETLSRKVQTGFDRETGEPIYETETLDLAPLPLIVVVVDEMADLMIVAGKEIEGLVQRLAQMARAAGIHLITATQRPSVDVITGTIKANFPTRISFQVTSKIDSRTILGEQGAEQLLGQGDMLYMAGGGRIRRVHGPFVSDAEVEAVVKHLKTQGVPEYLEAVTEEPDDSGPGMLGAEGGEEGDDLYRQALEIVTRDRKATTSYIQRRLQIGYNRAARIIERMEEEGVLSSPNHMGKREILLDEG